MVSCYIAKHFLGRITVDIWWAPFSSYLIKIFALKRPTGPIQSLRCDVRPSVCRSVCLRHWMHFFMRPLISPEIIWSVPMPLIGPSFLPPPPLPPSLETWKLGNLETHKSKNFLDPPSNWTSPPIFVLFVDPKNK